MLACEPKGRQFDSQSGHMSGLPARSPVRQCERGNHTNREEGREGEREKHTHPHWGSGDQTENLLMYRMTLRPTEPPEEGLFRILTVSFHAIVDSNWRL